MVNGEKPAESSGSTTILAILGLLLLILCGTPFPGGLGQVRAQDSTVEEQIPFDPAGSLYELGPTLRERLGVFEEAPDDAVARLFRAEDGRGVVEIAFERDGRRLRERRILSSDELQTLRSSVEERLAGLGPNGLGPDGLGPGTPGARLGQDGDGDGRVRLILWQTGLGLGFYGWTVPELLGLDGSRPRVAGYLITSGLSFLVPYLLTRDAPVSTAQGRMSGWGGTRGIAYGLLAADAIQGESDFGDDVSLGSALGLSLAGSYLGYHLPDRESLDEGTANLWSTMADLGTMAGFGAAHASGFYDEILVERVVEDDPRGEPITLVESERRNLRAGHLLVLGSTAAGLAAGRWLGGRDRYTRGDVAALRSAAVLGTQLALPLAEVAGGDGGREKRYAGAAVVGGIAGAVVGSRFLRGQDWSSGEGLLLNAGQVAGTLGALGITWLVTPDREGNELAFSLAQAVGGSLGLALTYRALGGASGSTGTASASDLEIRLSPAGPLLTIRF